jgi:hypothetical protein
MNDSEFMEDTPSNSGEEKNHPLTQNYIDDLNKTTREDNLVSNSNNKTWQNQVKIWSIILLIIGVFCIPLIFCSLEPVKDYKGKPSGAKFVFTFRLSIFFVCIFSIGTSILGIIAGFTRVKVIVILVI